MLSLALSHPNKLEVCESNPVMAKAFQGPVLGARHLTATLSFDPCEEPIRIPILQIRTPRLCGVAEDHTEAEPAFEFGFFDTKASGLSMTLCGVPSLWGNLFYKDDSPPSEKVGRNGTTAAQWGFFWSSCSAGVFFPLFFFS